MVAWIRSSPQVHLVNRIHAHIFVLLLALLVTQRIARADSGPSQAIAPGVWFTVGDASKGYSNTVIIEMQRSAAYIFRFHLGW